MEEKMPRQGTIAYHEYHIRKIRERYKKQAKSNHKTMILKEYGSFTDGHDNTRNIVDKKPKPRYRNRVEYDFLKYVRVIFKWATENNPELSRPDIEFLLYLYGVGAFSRKQFNDYHKLLGLYSVKRLNRFVDDGLIKLWRPQRGREHALYTLTHRTKILCNKMHRYACGVETLPMNIESNNMSRKGAPRINGYYLDMIKKMNKDKSE